MESNNRIVKVGNKDIDKDKFYTPEETEALLGVKSITIYRRVKDGSLKRSGSARIVFYKGEDIVQFIENGRN